MLRVPKWLALVAVLTFCASAAYAGTIVRGTKASGGTAFVDGYLASAGEVNTDLDRLYTLVNGNIDTNNINAAAGIVSGQIANDTLLNVDVNSVAAIAVSKLAQTAGLLDADIVGDYSDDAAEQATESSPGTSDTPTLATNLEKELEQLRYKLHELTVGSSASAVAASGATAALTSWVDGPIRTGNLLYNGGFDVWTSAADAAGDGWTLVLTPDTAETALTETDGQGDGNGMLITGNGAALEGISQTVTLKAGAKYLAIVSVLETAGDTCTLFVEDADTNDLTVASDAVGDWEVLAGTFQVDAVPTAVVFQLLATADTDVCLFNNAGLFEINTDPVPRGVVSIYDTYTGGAAVADAFAAVPDLSISFTPPGPGWVVQAGYTVNGGLDGNTILTCYLTNGGARVGGTEATGMGIQFAGTTSESSSPSSVYVEANPTPGTALTFAVECQDEGLGASYNSATNESNLWLIAFPPG